MEEVIMGMRKKTWEQGSMSGGLESRDNQRYWYYSHLARILPVNFRVKLCCDFGGSIWDGSIFEPGEGNETRYELPLRGCSRKDVPPIAKEIFALGSAVYEMTEWKIPDGELSEDDVDMKWRRDRRPEPSVDNPAVDIIKKCWLESYGSVFLGYRGFEGSYAA
ncbi:hypothetical protein B0T22DRAFT_440328 [Podospora appendiculata]|uniref:Uncharacterized protein n=1 Tax=Podospora appendiculata TaxID=314037 RepID=A0AAE1CCS0_9PEZI|nr:hypothetical protein B0T22DRAFT_440328 [Podospora appendiculata]